MSQIVDIRPECQQSGYEWQSAKPVTQSTFCATSIVCVAANKTDTELQEDFLGLLRVHCSACELNSRIGHCLRALSPAVREGRVGDVQRCRAVRPD